MANRGIEVHNGLVVFADVPSIETRGNPFEIRADQEVIDIDASPLSTVTALGTAKVLRLRGNVKDTDLTSGELRVLNIEARAAKDIATIDCVNLEPTVRSAADISGRIAGIMQGIETVTDAGTIAELMAMKVDFRLSKKPTYSAGILLESTGGQVVDWGIDIQKDYPLSPGKALMRFNNDICILAGSGAPVDGTSGTGAGNAGPGSIYLGNSKAYINTNTKASPTWTVVGSVT